MQNQFSRIELLIGKKAVKKLSECRVAVFGVGGVGGYVCEALVRSGIGAFDIVDDDVVALSNINRQIIAAHSTIGRYKVDVMKERMLDINPNVNVREYKCFFLPENADDFPFGEYDYVVDAVDTVTAKISIIMKAKEYGIPVISAMGAGNKLDPVAFKVADIYGTSVCPLAKVMRRELKKRGIKDLKVVYSEEMPLTPGAADAEEDNNNPGAEADGGKENSSGQEEISMHKAKRVTPGSTAFVPSVSGLIMAGEIIKDLTGISR